MGPRRARPRGRGLVVTPPLWGWFLLGVGYAVGAWGTVVAFGLGKWVVRGEVSQMRARADSIVAVLKGGTIVRLPDGRVAWVAPQGGLARRDTIQRRPRGPRD